MVRTTFIPIWSASVLYVGFVPGALGRLEVGPEGGQSQHGEAVLAHAGEDIGCDLVEAIPVELDVEAVHHKGTPLVVAGEVPVTCLHDHRVTAAGQGDVGGGCRGGGGGADHQHRGGGSDEASEAFCVHYGTERSHDTIGGKEVG